MMELFGRIVLDLTFEELIEVWQPSSYEIIDGYFALSSNEGRIMTHQMIVAWIRYFARIRDEWLSEEQQRDLVQKLMVQTIAYEDLPSRDRKMLHKLNLIPEEVFSKTPFLPHKTGVLMQGRVDKG